jgi:hypothetical protein
MSFVCLLNSSVYLLNSVQPTILLKYHKQSIPSRKKYRPVTTKTEKNMQDTGDIKPDVLS